MPGGRTPPRRLWWVAAAVAVVVAAGVVTAVATHGPGRTGGPPAATGTGTSRPGAPASGSGRVVSALEAGATGDGHTDDTAALQKALDALRPGDTLSLPAGRTFAHRAVLRIGTAGVTVTGGGTLLATNERASALEVDADGVTLSGITASTAHTTTRWAAPQQTGVWLNGHSDIVLTGITVLRSPSAGIFVFGTQNFRITGVTVRDTRADGIHMTRGAAHGTVTDVLTERTGDDGVAVVSYSDDPSQAGDIRIQSPHVHGTTGGRGVTVVGGSNVTVTNVDIRATAAAGIYVACERGEFQTRVPSGVSLSGGTVDHANQDGSVDQGAVLVYNGQGTAPLRDVTVQNLTISNTRASASRQVGLIAEHDGPLLGITLAQLAFTGTGPDTLLATESGNLQYRATGWTSGGATVPDRSAGETR
ncbi:MAG: hypothetical protein JWO98_22 [Frankiales bacterium]|nr:hypothetical protein [Frankiales bacterium]